MPQRPQCLQCTSTESAQLRPASAGHGGQVCFFCFETEAYQRCVPMDIEELLRAEDDIGQAQLHAADDDDNAASDAPIVAAKAASKRRSPSPVARKAQPIVLTNGRSPVKAASADVDPPPATIVCEPASETAIVESERKTTWLRKSTRTTRFSAKPAVNAASPAVPPTPPPLPPPPPPAKRSESATIAPPAALADEPPPTNSARSTNNSASAAAVVVAKSASSSSIASSLSSDLALFEHALQTRTNRTPSPPPVTVKSNGTAAEHAPPSVAAKRPLSPIVLLDAESDTPKLRSSRSGHKSSATTTRGARSRRHATSKRVPAVQPPDIPTNTRFVDFVFYHGSYVQLGDIVSLIGADRNVYYAQIRGLLIDRFCEKSAYLTWLLPTRSSPPPNERFDPSTYIVGPDDELSRRLDCMEFVMHAPSRYFHSPDEPYPVPDSMADDSDRVNGYIWASIGEMPAPGADEETSLADVHHQQQPPKSDSGGDAAADGELLSDASAGKLGKATSGGGVVGLSTVNRRLLRRHRRAPVDAAGKATPTAVAAK